MTQSISTGQMAGKGDVEGPALQPWLQLHAGPVSSISVLPDSRELLSAGLDGKLFVVSTQVQLSRWC